MRVVPAAEPTTFDLELGPLELEGGARIAALRLRGWMWSREEDHGAISARAKLGEGSLPTVLLIPPLTAAAPAGGPGGYWEPLIGQGRPLLPWAHRILSFAPLGSCHGSSGPADPGFPRRSDDARFAPPPPLVRGDLRRDEGWLPATVTPWDQARAVLAALDMLGVERVALVAGGSLGGMVALSLAVLAPERFARVLTIAAPLAATPWMIAWNHLGREALLRGEGDEARRAGLSVARQIARLSYRAEAGLSLRQGRRTAGDPQHGDPRWSTRTPYRVETYLRFHGDTFAEEFDARAYVCLLGAMDHHDLARVPFTEPSSGPWGPARVRASVMVARIDTDALVSEEASATLAAALRDAKVHVEEAVLESPHGHDAFLVEWQALGAIVRRALAMPPGA